MNKIYTVVTAVVLLAACSTSQQNVEETKISTTSDLVELMLSKRAQSVAAYTFIQETIFYDTAGNATDTSIWYEAVEYPDKFRIDLGALEEGNTALYKNDSLYRFREGLLDTTVYSPRAFLFMEGGFPGYTEVPAILDRFEELGYDTNQFYEAESAYVVGAASAADDSTKQVWLDKENFFMTRSIDQLSRNRALDMVYEDFEQIGDFWIETKVVIYIDGKLRQLEYYKEIDTEVEFNEDFFNPERAFSWHWFSE